MAEELKCSHRQFAAHGFAVLPCAVPGCRAGIGGDGMRVPIAVSASKGSVLKYERRRVGDDWRWDLVGEEAIDFEAIRNENLRRTLRYISTGRLHDDN